MKTFLTKSPRETTDLGKSFATSLRPGDVLALFGNLGTGKTQFINGVCQGLGVLTRATSPTFTIVNEYATPSLMVIHIDLFRIGSERELMELGIESYFNEGCICLIEWAEGALAVMPHAYHSVKLSYGAEENAREIEIRLKEEVAV